MVRYMLGTALISVLPGPAIETVTLLIVDNLASYIVRMQYSQQMEVASIYLAKWHENCIALSFGC